MRSSPTEVSDEGPREEEVHRCRQSALPGLPSHQRCLRNVAQNPYDHEEDNAEEYGLQSLGLPRG